jgi:hypothetical protein
MARFPHCLRIPSFGSCRQGYPFIGDTRLASSAAFLQNDLKVFSMFVPILLVTLSKSSYSERSRVMSPLKLYLKQVVFCHSCSSLRFDYHSGKGVRLPTFQNTVSSNCTNCQQVQIQVATFLYRELPIRLAQRIVDLESLPLMRESKYVGEVGLSSLLPSTLPLLVN